MVTPALGATSTKAEDGHRALLRPEDLSQGNKMYPDFVCIL